MKKVFKLSKKYYNDNDVSGLFVATDEEIQTLIKSKLIINLGEIFGKHSEIECRIYEHEITMFIDNQEFVGLVENEKPSIVNNIFDVVLSYDYDNVYHEDITVRELIHIMNDTKKKGVYALNINQYKTNDISGIFVATVRKNIEIYPC